nr:MAG TPA: hypothetical protein [Caudoviricetes sp.]
MLHSLTLLLYRYYNYLPDFIQQAIFLIRC